MNENNVKWTRFICDECGGFALYDVSHDCYYCEDCGLVLEFQQLME